MPTDRRQVSKKEKEIKLTPFLQQEAAWLVENGQPDGNKLEVSERYDWARRQNSFLKKIGKR